MRNVTWIRFGIAATIATVGAAGMLAVGCSDDDNVGTTPGVDSGTPDTGPKADTGVVDANKPDSQPLPPKDAGSNAKLILVHASPDVPAIRVCFGTGKLADGSDSVVQPLPALPDSKASPLLPYPGVFPGTGGAFPDITDLSNTAILPFIVLASEISTEVASDGGTEATCDQLVGTTKKACAGTKCLKPNQYIQLPAIPAQTFLKEKTFLLAAVGCFPNSVDDAGSASKCGDTYGDGGTGNVAVEISELDTTFAAPSGGIGVQFVHRSSVIEKFNFPTSATTSAQFAAGGLVPGLVRTVAVDAGVVDAGDAGDASIDAALPPTTTRVVQAIGPATKFRNNPPTPAIATVLDQNSELGMFLPNDAGTYIPATLPNGNELFGLTFGQIQQFTVGVAPPPSIFHADETYTFVLLGDPAAPSPVLADGGRNPDPRSGYSVRILAFPNHPVVKGL